ncbi:hypothetical protein [Streptomyces virginiae]|nr:hypothetical protein [Streptomyces sp. CMAA1738]MEC4575624.1 hypothetical protein [Streptomyces sp. CMAA1738]
MPTSPAPPRWGFSGPSVFSRTYRRMYGVSPSEFRELSVGA